MRRNIHLKKNPTWCTSYLQYISSNTSTCFGRVWSIIRRYNRMYTIIGTYYSF